MTCPICLCENDAEGWHRSWCPKVAMEETNEIQRDSRYEARMEAAGETRASNQEMDLEPLGGPDGASV